MKLPIENYQGQSNDVKMNCLRLYQWASQRSLRGVKFVVADDQYFNKTLEQRVVILNAPSIQFLCKTIIFENTAYDEKFKSKYYPQYVAVMVQYIGKIHTQKLSKEVRKLQQKGHQKISKQYYHFRLADENKSNELTGYDHNGVVPIMMKISMPMFCSHRIQALRPRCFWLGGGHPIVKMRMSYEQFVHSYDDQIVTADITY